RKRWNISRKVQRENTVDFTLTQFKPRKDALAEIRRLHAALAAERQSKNLMTQDALNLKKELAAERDNYQLAMQMSRIEQRRANAAHKYMEAALEYRRERDEFSAGCDRLAEKLSYERLKQSSETRGLQL